MVAETVKEGVEVVGTFVHINTVLGIISCGSGSGLARHLYIPMNVRKAVDIINTGTIEVIYTLTVNGIPYFCTAGVGYVSHISAEFAKGRGIITYANANQWSNEFHVVPKASLIDGCQNDIDSHLCPCYL